jgi:hypothetical protein
VHYDATLHKVIDALKVEDRACNDSGSANNNSVGQSIRRQLSGVKRRKQALEMLVKAIENGLKETELKETLEQQLADVAHHYSTGETPAKRLREEGGSESEEAVTDASESPVKKVVL